MNKDKKAIRGDLIAGIILFLGIGIPTIFQYATPYYDSDITYFHVINYVLTCLFAFAFICYIAIRVIMIFGKKKQ